MNNFLQKIFVLELYFQKNSQLKDFGFHPPFHCHALYMIHMPMKYYPYLVIELTKSVVISLMPKAVFDFSHKKRRCKS